MSLLARNALVLGAASYNPVDGNKWQQKSDGLIKDSSGGLVLPRAMSQKENVIRKKKQLRQV